MAIKIAYLYPSFIYINEQNIHSHLKDFIHNGSWNIPKVIFERAQNIKTKLASITVPTFEEND